MMAKIDKFFIAELQERGYDFDYKTLTEIYRSSRQRNDCIKRQIRNKRENELINKIARKLMENGME